MLSMKHYTLLPKALNGENQVIPLAPLRVCLQGRSISHIKRKMHHIMVKIPSTVIVKLPGVIIAKVSIIISPECPDKALNKDDKDSKDTLFNSEVVLCEDNLDGPCDLVSES